MKRLLCLLLCLLSSSAVLAAGVVGDVKKSVEGSMVVTGSIVVAPDGSVNSYTLDKQDKLPAPVVQIIAKTVPTWKFLPIVILDDSGKAMMAKASMSLRVAASPLENDQYSLTVRGASFGTGGSTKDPSYKTRTIPSYPRDAVQRGVSGVVYLALRVDSRGLVEEAEAQQVDLRFIADEGEMRAWDQVLSGAAIRAARNWTFNIPQSAHTAAGYEVIRVPVDFVIGYPKDAYGQWDAYVPGPVKQIPWMHSDGQMANRSADSIPNNGFAFQDDQRFVLLNPPGKG